MVLSTAVALLACVFLHADAAAPEAYDKEQLQAAARFRQQHRKATDGRLCAAASVQDEQTFTGCSVMPTPDGDVGKEWCRYLWRLVVCERFHGFPLQRGGARSLCQVNFIK